MRKAFEIINNQNHENISEEDFLDFTEIARHENNYIIFLAWTSFILTYAITITKRNIKLKERLKEF